MNFLFFFIILMMGFALQLDILSTGNIHIDGNFRTQNMVYNEKSKKMEIPDEYPGSEYKKIGLFFGNFLYVFRAAMGDFSMYNSSVYLL